MMLSRILGVPFWFGWTKKPDEADPVDRIFSEMEAELTRRFKAEQQKVRNRERAVEERERVAWKRESEIAEMRERVEGLEAHLQYAIRKIWAHDKAWVRLKYPRIADDLASADAECHRQNDDDEGSK